MSWKTVALGEIIELQNGFAFKSSEYADDGYFLMRITNVQQGFIQNNNPKYVSISENSKLKQFILNKGDILMSLTGDVGRVGVLKESNLPAALNQRVARVIIKSNREVDKSFIFNLLNSELLRNKIESLGHGAAQLNVSTKDILSIKIQLPSIQIQQKIVTKLDAIFSEIDKATAAAEANAKNAEALFQSYLTQVFERGGVDWKLDKLEKFVDIKHGFAFDGEDFEKSDNEDSPIVLTPGNFTEDGKLNFSTKNTKRLNRIDKISNQFNVGDLVVVMTDLSSKMKILGKPAIVDRENVLHNQRIGLFQFKENTVHKLFLYNFLKTRKYIDSIKATSTGSMVRHTAPKRILATTISYPKTEKQLELVSKFEDLSRITNNISIYQNRKINELNILKNSVLAKAFNGELVKE